MKIDPVAVLVAVAAAANVVFAELVLPTDFDRTEMLASEIGRVALVIFSLAALPFGLILPHVQARWLSRVWKVPYYTYLLPRWLVRMIVAAVLGQTAAVLGLSIFSDEIPFWRAGLAILSGAAFGLGAYLRLRHDPRTEWNMPWLNLVWKSPLTNSG